MNDFWEEFSEPAGEKALLTSGGLKINYSEGELKKHFGSLFEKRALEAMVGETAYWLLIPSLMAIYSFPVLLYTTRSVLYSSLSSMALMMVASLNNQASYNYWVNKYFVKLAVQPWPKAIFNLLFAGLLYIRGEKIWYLIIPFIWWVLNDRLPLIYLLSEMIIIEAKKWLYKLPNPAGVLIRVCYYWAKRYGMEISTTGKVIGSKFK